MLHCKFS